MLSWLELVFNIIGYGGFVVVASQQWPSAGSVADEGRHDQA